MRLKDRIAVVTGAGSGIGRASALLFAREGALVALVDRDEAGMTETLQAVRASNGQGSAHRGDVGDGEFARPGGGGGGGCVISRQRRVFLYHRNRPGGGRRMACRVNRNRLK